MAGDDGVVDFIGEQFRRLNLRFDKVDERLDRLEARVVNIERRLTGMHHFEQSMVAHVASIHSGIDDMRADFLGIQQRLTALEVANAR